MAQLKTPEECERFAANAIRLSRPDLANEARRRAVDLRADAHGATSGAEKECLRAIYAYEEVLSKKNGKRTRATRTWQMIDRHGILGAAERAVNRPKETAGYTVLVEMGLEDLAFEAVILKYPDCFAPEVVEISRQRLADHKHG